jgi:hypothetical protein
MDLDERIRRSPPSRYPRTDIPDVIVIVDDPLQRIHDAMRLAQEFNTPLEGNVEELTLLYNEELQHLPPPPRVMTPFSPLSHFPSTPFSPSGWSLWPAASHLPSPGYLDEEEDVPPNPGDGEGVAVEDCDMENVLVEDDVNTEEAALWQQVLEGREI